MTPEEIADLKRLAEAANVDSGEPWYGRTWLDINGIYDQDADFVAAIKPETILRLIAHVEELKADRNKTAVALAHAVLRADHAEARIDRALAVAHDPGARSSVALSAVRETLSAPSEGEAR